MRYRYVLCEDCDAIRRGANWAWLYNQDPGAYENKAECREDYESRDNNTSWIEEHKVSSRTFDGLTYAECFGCGVPTLDGRHFTVRG